MEWNKFIESLDVKIDTDKDKLKDTLIDSIKNSLPENFGVLFSGGIDSTFIAQVCKQLGENFTCYCVGLENSEDIIEAEKVSKALNLKLKKKVYSLDEANQIIKETVKILNDTDVMKVGVGSTLLGAIKIANEKYLFSGLGSEEIFAGYQRHEQAKDINEECWNGLRNMYERDISRDEKIANASNVKILTPFLNKDVIIHAMNIPGKEKIKNNVNKSILREIALDIGIPKDIALRKKRAAQYGSKFDRAILRLARRNGFKYKKDYLESVKNHLSI